MKSGFSADQVQSKMYDLIKPTKQNFLWISEKFAFFFVKKCLNLSYLHFLWLSIGIAVYSYIKKWSKLVNYMLNMNFFQFFSFWFLSPKTLFFSFCEFEIFEAINFGLEQHQRNKAFRFQGNKILKLKTQT